MTHAEALQILTDAKLAAFSKLMNDDAEPDEPAFMSTVIRSNEDAALVAVNALIDAGLQFDH